MNKSAASAASSKYVEFQAVIKSVASAASPGDRGGRASGRFDHGFLFAIFGRASAQKIVKISVSVMPRHGSEGIRLMQAMAEFRR